ncbi:MAG: Xaa-Pro peptidase family protein [Terriglobales bacterium]
MISRRRFLETGAIAGITLGASPLIASSNACPALPPPIAALKSWKDQAVPVTKEERLGRQENARRLMAANGLDAIVLMEGTSLEYFSGIRWWGGERFFAMILSAKGPAFYVCPAFEEARAREQMAKAPGGDHADIRIWQEDENPYQLLAQGLKDRGVASGTVGLEETVRFVFQEGIAKAAPQLTLTSATAVTAGCRRIKSDHEIDLMRLASRVTLTVYEAAYRALKAGMTRGQLEALIVAGYDRIGFPGEVTVQVDGFTAVPHGSESTQVIHDGSIILLDDGCTVEGYISDITRTFVLGKATGKMKSVFDIVHRAQTAALKTARAGIECQAVDAAARKIIVDAGYGPGYKFFAHRLGHGMGMDGHEWPYLVGGNTTLLAQNMTFSDEPGIYIPGEFGIRLEDDMHITESGAELFTPQSPSLEDPFGA